MVTNFYNYIFMLAFALLTLSGCGGGGGDSTVSPTNDSTNEQPPSGNNSENSNTASIADKTISTVLKAEDSSFVGKVLKPEDTLFIYLQDNKRFFSYIFIHDPDINDYIRRYTTLDGYWDVDEASGQLWLLYDDGDLHKFDITTDASWVLYVTQAYSDEFSEHLVGSIYLVEDPDQNLLAKVNADIALKNSIDAVAEVRLTSLMWKRIGALYFGYSGFEYDFNNVNPPHWRATTVGDYVQFTFHGAYDFKLRALGSAEVEIKVNQQVYESRKSIASAWKNYYIPSSAFNATYPNYVLIKVLSGSNRFWIDNASIGNFSIPAGDEESVDSSGTTDTGAVNGGTDTATDTPASDSNTNRIESDEGSGTDRFVFESKSDGSFYIEWEKRSSGYSQLMLSTDSTLKSGSRLFSDNYHSVSKQTCTSDTSSSDGNVIRYKCTGSYTGGLLNVNESRSLSLSFERGVRYYFYTRYGSFSYRYQGHVSTVRQ